MTETAKWYEKAGNCGDVTGAPNGDMRLAKVATFEDAKDAVEAWEARGALGGSDEWRQLPPENRL